MTARQSGPSSLEAEKTVPDCEETAVKEKEQRSVSQSPGKSIAAQTLHSNQCLPSAHTTRALSQSSALLLSPSCALPLNGPDNGHRKCRWQVHSLGNT